MKRDSKGRFQGKNGISTLPEIERYDDLIDASLGIFIEIGIEYLNGGIKNYDFGVYSENIKTLRDGFMRKR